MCTHRRVSAAVKPTHTHTCKQMSRRQTDRQAGRQADRQTNPHTLTRTNTQGFLERALIESFHGALLCWRPSSCRSLITKPPSVIPILRVSPSIPMRVNSGLVSSSLHYYHYWLQNVRLEYLQALGYDPHVHRLTHQNV